jgi:heme exporter protein C
MRKICLTLSFILLTTGWLICMTFGRVQPQVRNIIYTHVPAAITAMLCMAGVLTGSVQFLRTKDKKWDNLAAASVETGFVFALVLNITGSIFARAEWGLWWTPSARLVSSAMLGFLYAAYLVLRVNTPSRIRNKLCAVIGIIISADVPFVFVSARFLRDIHQPSFTFQADSQYLGFAMLTIGTILLAVGLIALRIKTFELNDEILLQEKEL